MRSKGLGWLWGLTELRKLNTGGGWGWRRNTGGGAGGSADGPCGVLYGKHSMFLVRKGSRDICSQQLIELACT